MKDLICHNSSSSSGNQTSVTVGSFSLGDSARRRSRSPLLCGVCFSTTHRHKRLPSSHYSSQDDQPHSRLCEILHVAVTHVIYACMLLAMLSEHSQRLSIFDKNVHDNLISSKIIKTDDTRFTDLLNTGASKASHVSSSSVFTNKNFIFDISPTSIGNVFHITIKHSNVTFRQCSLLDRRLFLRSHLVNRNI